jgi:hypothetical protein
MFVQQMFLAKYQMLDDVPNKYGQYLQIPGGCKNRLEHARGRERNETLDLVSCHILEDRTSRSHRIRLDQSSSRDELLKFIQLEDESITEDQIKSLVDLMDKNKDGSESKKEFLYRYTLNRERFTSVGTDQSGGNVSLSELNAFIQKERRQYCFFHKKYYDKTTTEKEMCLLLERMVTSQDDKVSKNELHTHTHTHTHIHTLTYSLTDSLIRMYIHTFPCGTWNRCQRMSSRTFTPCISLKRRRTNQRLIVLRRMSKQHLRSKGWQDVVWIGVGLINSDPKETRIIHQCQRDSIRRAVISIGVYSIFS